MFLAGSFRYRQPVNPPVYLTPGPTELHPAVAPALAEAATRKIGSISHRSSDFHTIFRETSDAVRRVIELPAEWHLGFLGSATEGWERVVQGLAERGSWHLVCGAFGARWSEIAALSGARVVNHKVSPGVATHLTPAAIDAGCDLFSLVHNETSTGLLLPRCEIEAVRSAVPDGLIALDVVSSTPMVAIPWELIDVALFSVQKGFGLPSGLGVIAFNERARERVAARGARGVATGSFHALDALAAAAKRFETPETPNVLGIYLLGKVAHAMLDEGVSKSRETIAARAHELYAACGAHPVVRPFVTAEAYRSPSVVVIDCGGEQSLLKRSIESHGIFVGSGYGEFKDRHLRIANFPGHPEEAFQTILAVLRGTGTS